MAGFWSRPPAILVIAIGSRKGGLGLAMGALGSSDPPFLESRKEGSLETSPESGRSGLGFRRDFVVSGPFV